VVTDDNDTVLKTWSWQYDPAGNRLRESLDTASIYSEYNDLNQLTQRGGSGNTLVDQPAIVMVNDEQAAMFALPDGDYRFRRTVPAETGSNTITDMTRNGVAGSRVTRLGSWEGLICMGMSAIAPLTR